MLDEKIKTYLDWKGTYAPRAFVNYRIWLEYFVKIAGNKEIEEYTIGDIVKYQQWLEKRFSPYCICFAITVIKNFFKFYKDQNSNCIQPSLIKIPQSEMKHHRAITEGEFERLIAEVPSGAFINLRDKLLIRMLWDTGVRVSELCDLNLTQISEDKNSTVICSKKSKKKRVIIWSQETHNLLMRYMTERMELNKSGSTPALFIGKQGADWSLRITSRTVQRAVRQYLLRAGIKEKLTPHSFRHGWAHKRRDMNAPLSFIQHGLGHLSPVSTFIYQNYHDKEFESNAMRYLQAA